MKKISIGLAQTKSEFFCISKKIKKNNLYWLPLNLEMYIFYKKKKINFIDPRKLFVTKDHLNSIKFVEKKLKHINFKKDLEFEALSIRFKTILRKYINSLIFFIILIENLKKKKIINNFFVSGWDSFNFESKKNNYFISKICNHIYKKKTIAINSLEKKEEYYYNIYALNKLNLNKKKYIVLNNLGYNFFRIVKFFFKKKIRLLILEENKINNLKRIIYKYFGVSFFNPVKKKIKKIIIYKNIKFNLKFRKFSLTKLIYSRNKKIFSELMDLKEKYKTINKWLSKHKPISFICNHSRGLTGMVAENLNKKKIKTILISHGTISNGNTIIEKKYNKVISEDLLNSSYNIYCNQTKISQSVTKKLNPNIKEYNSGNIIFTQINKNYEKKFIVYAVTARDFLNLQFCGIETFYEIYENFNFLNQIQKKIKHKIVVNLHPNIEHLKNDLENIFKNINFTNNKISELLSKSLMLISFSSTVIEEALVNKIPVILFDPWKRYKHCDAEKNYQIRNCSVYYANTRKNFLKYVNTILKSDKIFFNYSINNNSWNRNLENLFSHELKF